MHSSGVKSGLRSVHQFIPSSMSHSGSHEMKPSIVICAVFCLITVFSDPTSSQIVRPAVQACQNYSDWAIGNIDSKSLIESNEFPWMVSLVYFNLFNYGVRYGCAGTIISEWYVLTAAHCLTGDPPVKVLTGKMSLIDIFDERAVTYSIRDIIKHPDWDPQRIKNDIALVRVSSKIKFDEFVSPSCLEMTKEDLPVNTNMIVPGWNSIKVDMRTRDQVDRSKGQEKETLIQELCKTDMISMTLQECNGTYSKYNEHAKLRSLENGISETQFCASNDPLGSDQNCHGNCGGPIHYFPEDSSLPSVVGVVSFRVQCGIQMPGVHTRVSHYMNWIESIVWPNH